MKAKLLFVLIPIILSGGCSTPLTPEQRAFWGSFANGLTDAGNQMQMNSDMNSMQNQIDRQQKQIQNLQNR